MFAENVFPISFEGKAKGQLPYPIQLLEFHIVMLQNCIPCQTEAIAQKRGREIKLRLASQKSYCRDFPPFKLPLGDFFPLPLLEKIVCHTSFPFCKAQQSKWTGTEIEKRWETSVFRDETRNSMRGSFLIPTFGRGEKKCGMKNIRQPCQKTDTSPASVTRGKSSPPDSSKKCTHLTRNSGRKGRRGR